MTAPGRGVRVVNGWPLPAAGYAIHAFGGDPKVATPPDDVKDAVRMVADVGGVAAQVAVQLRPRRLCPNPHVSSAGLNPHVLDKSEGVVQPRTAFAETHV